MKSIKEILEAHSLRTVKSGSKLIDVIKYMASENIGLVPVLDEGKKLIGVFSERDLLKRVIAKELDMHQTIVDDVMTTKLILADVNETYEECLQKMRDAKIRHIIIVDKGELNGILSMRDLLQIDITVHKETIDVLHNYIYSK